MKLPIIIPLFCTFGFVHHTIAMNPFAKKTLYYSRETKGSVTTLTGSLSWKKSSKPKDKDLLECAVSYDKHTKKFSGELYDNPSEKEWTWTVLEQEEAQHYFIAILKASKNLAQDKKSHKNSCFLKRKKRT